MFKRLMNVIRGFLGLFISGLEASNPEALIESEKENLRSSIGKFNENLATQAGFVEKLNRQIKKNEQDERQLTAKIKAYINAGQQQLAGQLAVQLQQVKQNLEAQREQYAAAEKQFQSLSKQRDIATKQAKDKLQKLENMVSETRMHEAQAELQEMAKGMIGSVGSMGDGLNRIEGLLEQKRDKAVGRSRVAITAGGIDEGSDLSMKEAEMNALGDAALAEFMAMNGMGSSTPQISLEKDDPVAVPQRGMGSME